MQTTGNTILITGGGSGIGRALAEAFHQLGNQVIISGRRQEALAEVTAANPGMAALTVDMMDADSIKAFADEATTQHPGINVVIHNAGIMKRETLADAPDFLATAEDTIATNLLGPIRLTAALLPHLLKQKDAAILTVSSGLAFVPMAATPTYSATKAAIHSYSMGLRRQLAETPVQVIEIVPPYVQTTLMGDRQANDPTAMPLTDFITEVMDILTNQPDAQEVVVERCKPLRYAAETGNLDKMFEIVSGLNH
ncbi:SDR family oxidoreductase [Pseudorhizobium pelagicum]|uniref:DltE n=1 Tax=Pseudorhizobium pelagicum TaxID=1509405 RepID=A0A922P1W3_9HYPH|nr:SDR family oxidoreductase [Pseudorhizobium pelagicum]KEQ05007.1 DltE [Pseudorhizobium pelagicum]KEQ07520.1 DltE [Pseudorhizobium pelagicum]